MAAQIKVHNEEEAVRTIKGVEYDTTSGVYPATTIGTKRP